MKDAIVITFFLGIALLWLSLWFEDFVFKAKHFRRVFSVMDNAFKLATMLDWCLFGALMLYNLGELVWRVI